MRIIIAGAGSVGTHLVKMFTESNHDVVVIDNDKERLQEISAHFDAMTIHGTATSMSVLAEAEASKAKLFVAVSNYQETNILSCIIAKKIGAKQTIARVDNREYISAENEEMIRNLGVDSLVYPEIIVSDEIAQQLRYPGILKSVNFASGKIFLFSIRINERSELALKSLVDIDKAYPDIQARIVAIHRGPDTIIPRGADVVLPEDVLYIITDKIGKDFIQQRMGVSSFEVKNVMILGGSRIGVKLAKNLEKNCYVKLFEKSREKSFLIADELKDTLVIHSEARSADFLLDEGIGRTDAFIAVTGNSEINMLSCMLAKKLGVKKTYAEVENTDYLELIHKTDIDYVVNKKLIAASKIFTHSVDAEVLSMKFIADIEAQVFEFVVHEKSKITKKQLKDLDFPQHAIIGGIVRDNEPQIAVGATVLKTNDRVVVFCLPQVASKVAKWFK
ncbi:MAG: Trk system potassium transporter TrkA [Bacteroidales bacterium]|nr:Trk system potassium transporter TrkA [Bacteroidales bacterium]